MPWGTGKQNLPLRKAPNPVYAMLLILLTILLEQLFSLRFNLYGVEAVRIGFASVPVLFGSIWLGPFWGMLIGGSSDLIGFLLRSNGPYIPLITLISILRGFLPGFLVPFTGDSRKIRNLCLQITLTQVLCSVILMPLVLYRAFGIPVLENIVTRGIIQSFAVPLYLGIIYVFIHQLKSRETLLVSEAKYRSIFDAARDALLVFNRDGIIVEANPAALRSYGYQRKDFLGLTGRDIVHPDYQHLFARFTADVQQKGFFSAESVDIRQDGSFFHVEVNGTGILFHGEDHLLAVVRDISDRKEAEKKLAHYTQQLERLYQQLDREIKKAIEIHQRTLPTTLPTISGISFAAYYQPAQRLGGDFYDVIQRGNRLVLYLSDVSGHGLDGAMLSVFVKQTIRGFLSFTPKEDITPRRILPYVYEQFKEENYPEEYYICIFLAVFDLERLEMTYSGLGFQDTPFVQMGDGKRERLVSRGLFISSLFPPEELNFSEDRISLSPGATILFNTDGLTEQRVAGGYYRERLPQVFYQHAHLAPYEISQIVAEDFLKMKNGTIQGEDDITFLVMQIERDRAKTEVPLAVNLLE